MSTKKKIYLFATQTDKTVKFQTHDNSLYWYWAWGNEKEPKFIIKALVELYWLEEWYEVYKKYNDALLYVSDMNKNSWLFKRPTACITLYYDTDDSVVDWTKENFYH